MTYDEIGSLLNCSADEARSHVQLERLDRKRSRDGNTRVKLNADLTAAFLSRIRSADSDLDHAIGELRRVRTVMGNSMGHGTTERARSAHEIR